MRISDWSSDVCSSDLSRIELWARHQLVGGQNVDVAAPLLVSLQQVGDVERRLAEETVAALAFELEQLALDRADAGLGDIAVAGGEVGRVFGTVDQQRLQILEVEEEKSILVGAAASDVQHALLRLVEVRIGSASWRE